jgi:hypothetical protein
VPFFIPASIIVPALAKTSAEVSAWLILEHCGLSSIGTAGFLYFIGALNKSQRFLPLQVDEAPLHQVSLKIQDTMLRTNESILKLCEILGEVKGHVHQIRTDDKISDEVCQNILLHLTEIQKSMELIHQLFQDLKKGATQDEVVFSQTLQQIKLLEKTLDEVKLKSFERIQNLERELEAKDTTIQRFFEVNQALKERISSLTGQHHQVGR